ncbi:MAG TPA: hypothetical protein VHW01_03930 [Polyangiaceae bacterium]|nr:hypothetical protein [Polyangiaceae bacterium]
MDSKTHRRGPADTSNGRFAKVLAVSVLLHVPFTPWAALVGLLGLWSPPAEVVDSPPITGIPVDLIEDQLPATPPNPDSASTPDNAGPADPAGMPINKPKPAIKPADAGAADAEADADSADAGLEAGSADAGIAKTDAGSESKDSDAGSIADAGSKPDAGARPLSDPTLVAGAKQIADPNANVRITIYTEKIRQNPLGARIGPLLRSLYQWRDFFGPTAIDPIRDVDQILVVGSQLRDSSNVIAILRHHLPIARMRAAIDALVRADQAGGEWLDAGVPAAAAHADGAERRFVLANSQTVVVAPPTAYKGVLAAGKMIRLVPSSGPEAAMIYLATPWRAFLGLPIKVPQSIKWARVRVTPTADGGATAEIEAEDTDDATATEDAAYLTRTANALSQLNLGFLGSLLGQQSHKFIERVSFGSEGNKIHGEAQVTADQLSTALDMAGAFLADRATRRVAPKAVPSAGH